MFGFPVSVDFEHVDTTLEAARFGTAAAWGKVLAHPIGRQILAHARVNADELAVLLAMGLSGEPLPENMAGYLARKALRSGDLGFVRFVGVVRQSADRVAKSASEAAAAYLPKPWPRHVAVCFVSFAFADAFSAGEPIINLGDFYFGVHKKISGDETGKTAKTLGLLQRIMAHELHHAGLGQFLCFPETPDSRWLLKFIVSEGTAMLPTLPLSEDDGYYFANWQRHTGKFADYLTGLPDVLIASSEGIPDDVFRQWVLNVGAGYYVGATMAVAVEKAFGRERLVSALADVVAFFDAYDNAAVRNGLPRLKEGAILAYSG